MPPGFFNNPPTPKSPDAPHVVLPNPARSKFTQIKEKKSNVYILDGESIVLKIKGNCRSVGENISVVGYEASRVEDVIELV